MAFADLSRRFIEWRDDELSDPDLRSRYGLTSGTLSWENLLAKRRIVILAEAGSGKTEELKEQARLQVTAGRFAFYATVEDVGRYGLEGALRVPERVHLAAWCNSDQDAWFFVDSVDEAKLNRVRLESALRRVAEGIGSAQGSAHIILSGRHTDWEFRRDLVRLNDELPIPRNQVAPPAPTADELVIRTIRREHRRDKRQPDEAPLVVVMAPLDSERVRLFAKAKQVANVDAFIAEINSANLWQFARRPLDLEWLVHFWRTHGRLGTLAEMLESSLKERLKESDPSRAGTDSLNASDAFDTLERVGAAMVFGRKTTISIPDAELTLFGDMQAAELEEILPDWSSTDCGRFLTRAVFDPATFGRARLHNDNQGVVRSYLAARWLHRLRKANLSQQGLFDLLFANTYGIELIKPSMLETAAWLSLWDREVAREVTRRAPYLLFTAGDPGSLAAPVRQALLTKIIAEIESAEAEPPILDLDSLKRFAKPDITETVRAIWSAHQSQPKVRELMLQLIWLGGLRDCADLASAAAFGQYEDRYTRLLAGRALVAACNETTKRCYGEYVRTQFRNLPKAVIWDALEGLFPKFLGRDSPSRAGSVLARFRRSAPRRS